MRNQNESSEFRFGEGQISGYIACFLAIICFLGVIAFHFPAYLTTPELRAAYDVNLLRGIMFYALILSGSLGLLNFVRNKKKMLGGIAWVFIVLAIALGGHRVEIIEYPQDTLYLGLDWFLLDLLGSTLIFVFIEKLFPHKKDQAILRPHLQTDLNHFLVNHLLVGFVLLIATGFVEHSFSWTIASSTQTFILGLPFALQIFLIILAADLFQYASHRAYHEVPLLWRLHAVHHSAKHMDWIAGSRQHIIELILTRSFVLIPIFILGFPKVVIDTYVVIVGFQAVFNHANVQVNFGWLKYIIVTPQFHHWHHASDDAAIDRNYAAHFAFIDYLFGTAVTSKDQWPEEYGVVGDYVPDGMLKQQIFPFVWKKQ